MGSSSPATTEAAIAAVMSAESSRSHKQQRRRSTSSCYRTVSKTFAAVLPSVRSRRRASCACDVTAPVDTEPVEPRTTVKRSRSHKLQRRNSIGNAFRAVFSSVRNRRSSCGGTASTSSGIYTSFDEEVCESPLLPLQPEFLLSFDSNELNNTREDVATNQNTPSLKTCQPFQIYRKTLQQEWNEERRNIMEQILSKEQAYLKCVEERVDCIRSQLRYSTEAMREDLLEQSQDYTVRDAINKCFAETCIEIKKDLHRLRDKQTAEVEASTEVFVDTLTKLDNRVATTEFMQYYTGEETWAEYKEAWKIVKPELGKLFRAVDQMALPTAFNDAALQTINKSMDRLQSNMEDQLDGLKENIHLKTKILKELVERDEEMQFIEEENEQDEQ